ncbi:Sit1p [Kluyveromyces marxianus]
MVSLKFRRDVKAKAKQSDGQQLTEIEVSKGGEKVLNESSSIALKSEDNEEITKTRGVTRIEAVKKHMTGKFFWLFVVSINITSWVLALDSSTTSSYQPYATSSFDRHSMLSTLSIANSVIGAVCQPFIAKISDLTSRPVTYAVVLIMYIIGFVVTACSPTISAYVIGSVFITIGQNGLNLLNSIVIADMTDLKWRALFTSLLSVPYLVTTWVAGYITQDIIDSNWRWGYGMFAIITPVALTPAILLVSYLDHEANKRGEVPIGTDPLAQSKQYIEKEGVEGFKAKLMLLKSALIEIDAFGLILLGFAFSLILLPCSLYPYAKEGWSNPSMIAMEVVGGIFLICYAIFEIWIAPFPLLPKRVLMNRTFICCVIIDFIYQMAGYFPLLYFTSYTRVALNLSIQHWTYLSNITTMGLCFFGVFWGVLFRIFRRYKVFQVGGTGIKLIGMGLYAAVPHQDMAATISVLSLYSSIGAAIGSAITTSIWTSELPKALLKHIPDPKVAMSFFEDISLIAAEPWGSTYRLGAIEAYQEVLYKLFCMGVGVSSIMLITAMLQTNYYLGDQQNCIEGKQVEDYKYNRDGSKKTLLDRVTDFWNKPMY